MFICNAELCTGCGVCANACPTNCISIGYNQEGFLVPTIDETKCLNCKRCVQTCPVNGEKFKKSTPIMTVRGRSLNKEILMRSSSGGIFSELTNAVINRGGMVAGAVLEDDFTVAHMLSSDKTTIQKMCGSKYIGSRIGNVYQQIKQELNNGRWVLFSGTPCQVAGLKNYLNNVNDERLLTCDFICHGVGSQKVFQLFLDELSRKHNSSVERVRFRDKCKGYKNSQMTVLMNSGKRLCFPSYNNTFGYPFSSGKINRISCSSCKYASVERNSDITLADMVHDLSHEESKFGCSLILVNTEKGQELLSNCNIQTQPVELEYVKSIQPHLCYPQPANQQRSEIFSQIDKMSFKLLSKTYFQAPKINIITRIMRKVKRMFLCKK